MEVVKVKEKDLNLIKEFAKYYTLSDLFDAMDSGRELEHLKGRYGYDKTAAIWLGHYEIEKDNIELLEDAIQYSLNNHSMGNYAVGYRDALKLAIEILKGRNGE